MSPRFLIIGGTLNDISIGPLLESFLFPIIPNFNPERGKTYRGDLAIILVNRFASDFRKLLVDLHGRISRCVVFAAQSADHDLSVRDQINGRTAVEICTKHHCFDVMLGSRIDGDGRNFLEKQVHEFVSGTPEPRPTIHVRRVKGKAFIAMPYEPFWNQRCDHYIHYALKSKGFQADLARQKSYNANRLKMKKAIDAADFVIAGICDREDVSGRCVSNPNVCFEAGMAWAMGKPLILAVQGPHYKVPADFESLPRIDYHDNMDLALQIVRRLKLVKK
jgi:hypothetical protein